MRYDKGPGHVRVGRLLLTWNARLTAGAPLIDGCWTYLKHDDGPNERFGGVAIRKPWKRREHYGYSICWKDAPMADFSVKRRIRHARWVLAGRPLPPPASPNATHSATPADAAFYKAPRPGGLR